MFNHLVYITIFLFLSLSGCEEAKTQVSTSRVIPYQEHTSFIGTIEASERSLISTPINGIIDEVYVQPGSFVEANQPILSLQSDAAEETLLKNLAREAIVKSQAERLSRKLEAYTDLFAEGIISQNEFDAIKNSKIASEYELIEVKQTLSHICPLVRNSLCQANTEKIAHSLPIFLDFKSPQKGQLIGTKTITKYRKGTTLKAHETLFYVVDVSSIIVSVVVNDHELHALPLNQKVILTLGPDQKKLQGTVKSYQGIPSKHHAQPQFMVSILSEELPPNLQKVIQIGASATITPSTESSLFLVPTNSLSSDTKGTFVQRINGPDSERVEVTPMHQLGEYWLVNGALKAHQHVKTYDSHS